MLTLLGIFILILIVLIFGMYVLGICNEDFPDSKLFCYFGFHLEPHKMKKYYDNKFNKWGGTCPRCDEIVYMDNNHNWI